MLLDHSVFVGFTCLYRFALLGHELIVGVGHHFVWWRVVMGLAIVLSLLVCEALFLGGA